ATSSQQVRIDGHVERRAAEEAGIVFSIPATVKPGVWRLWATGSKGSAAGLNINVVDERLTEETSVTALPVAINRELTKPGEKRFYRIEGRASQPLHFWTIAAQLGVPYLDSVLMLRDASGKKLAENDDVVAGQGTLVGNPDSSLFFTPTEDGPLMLDL